MLRSRNPDELSGPCVWACRPAGWQCRLMGMLGFEPEFYATCDWVGVPGRSYRWRRRRG